MKSKEAVILGLIILLSLAFRIYLASNLSLLGQESLFISQFIRGTIYIPNQLTLLLGVGNLILLWFIARNYWNRGVALWTAALYALSPWASYLEVSNSVNIFTLFWILVLVLSVLLLKRSNERIYGFLIFLLAAIFSVLSSIQMFVIIPILVLSLMGLNNLSLALRKQITLSLTVSLMSLLLLLFTQPALLKQQIFREISLYNNVGLINSVNQFRGETQKQYPTQFAKIIENRYFYFSEHLLSNFLSHLAPVVYFTPEYRLLGFSFSPPIFLALIIPFFIALYDWLKNIKDYPSLMTIFIALILPSVLSRPSPDLSKLVLVSPLFFLAISAGFYKLLNSKERLLKTLSILVILTVIFQMTVVLADIKFREPIRLERTRSN